MAAGRCPVVTGGCHPVIEGSEWPEHHKSPVGNALAPIQQIKRLRPREETAPQSKSVSRSSVPFTLAALWRRERGCQHGEPGGVCRSWSAIRGSSLRRSRVSFPPCHPLSLRPRGGGLSMAPGLSSPLSFLPLPLSPPLLTGQF